MRMLCNLAQAILLSANCAMATAQITVTYSFDVGGFTVVDGISGTTPPVTTISGDFTATFEPNSGSGINSSMLDSISLTIEGFDYTPASTQLIVRNAQIDTDIFSGRIEIGGEENGGVYGGGDFSDDFSLFFTDSGGLTGISAENFHYTVKSEAGFFDATTFNISRVSISIPEPSSLSLTLFVVTGYYCWRRRRLVV